MNVSQLLQETFRVHLSEIEVRLTLRELCGSKWDGCPFQGEVYENSFSVRENTSGTRGNLGGVVLGGVVLEGSFYEENGKTTVSIVPNVKPSDLAVYLLFAIVSAAILCYGMSEMFISLLVHGGEGFFTAFLAAIAGGAFLGIVYSMVVGSYQRSVETLRKAFRAAQRNEEA